MIALVWFGWIGLALIIGGTITIIWSLCAMAKWGDRQLEQARRDLDLEGKRRIGL